MAEDKKPEILETLTAGSHPVLYILDQSESMVRIQRADDDKRYIDVFKSALPTFIQMLQRVSESVKRP